jgi:hypothetical protein
MRSLGSCHHRAIGHLVAVLAPADIRPDVHDAFADWVARALDGALPERLRFAIVDSIDTPRLSTLLALNHPLVHVDSPDIDALQTAQETFAQEAAVGPAAVFRNQLMGLVTLVDRAPADQVRIKAADAVAFARKHGWADQEVVIAVLVSGALLKARRGLTWPAATPFAPQARTGRRPSWRRASPISCSPSRRCGWKPSAEHERGTRRRPSRRDARRCVWARG